MCGVQAEKKDGGRSFMCAESSAWRTDSKCSESPSDFMTAGEHFGEAIPAVPKGFVRWVQLFNINERNRRNYFRAVEDRKAYYIYCGQGDTVPDTRGWQPFGGQLAAAMADRRGSQRIERLLPQATRPSVASILEENPVLVSEGVTLDDFSFSKAKSASLAPSAGAASAVQQSSPALPVPPAAAPLEVATPQPSHTPKPHSAVKRKATLQGSPSSDDAAEPSSTKLPRTSSEAQAV